MEHGDGRRWYRVSIGRNDCNPNDPSMKYASPITLSSHITNTNSNKFINNTNATTTNNEEDNNKNNSNYFDDDDDEVVTFIDMTNSFELDPKSGYHKDSYLYSARTGHSIVYYEKKLFIFGGLFSSFSFLLFFPYHLNKNNYNIFDRAMANLLR